MATILVLLYGMSLLGLAKGTTVDLNFTTLHEKIESSKTEAEYQINVMKSFYDDLQGRMGSLTIKVTSLETTLRTEINKNDILEAKVETLQTKESTLRAENAHLKARLQTVETEVRSSNFVGFTAYTSVDIRTHPGQKIVFDSTLTNTGGGYNTATGEFTCPLRGYYYFSLSVYANHRQRATVLILRNHTPLTSVMSNFEYYIQASTGVVTLCNAGDKIWMRSADSASLWIARKTQNANSLNSFCGFLLQKL